MTPRYPFRARHLAFGVALLALSPVPAVGQDAPTASSATPAATRVPVRSGVHPTYSRLVFDWPRNTPYTLEQAGTAVTIRFPVAAEVDLAAVVRARPTRIANLTQAGADGALIVRFDVPAGAGVRHSRAGTRIVVDIQDNSPPAAAPAPTTPASVTPTPAAAATTSPPPPPAPTPAQQAQARIAAENRAREGAPLYELRGRPAPAGAAAAPSPVATGAPVPLAPPVPPSSAPASPPPPGPAATASPAATPAPAATVPPAAPTPSTTATAAVSPASIAAPDPAQAGVEAPAQPVTLTFDPKSARSAAIYERAGYLYILFDEAVPPDTMPAPIAGYAGTIEPIAVTDGGGFRLPMPALSDVSVKRDNTAWLITLTRASEEAGPTGAMILTATPDPEFALGPRLVVAAEDAEKVLTFTDPVVGDTLSVVPLPVPGPHVPVPMRYAEAQLLPTLQGLVIRPLNDRLVVQPSREGVEITVPGGLRLSPGSDTQVATPPPPPPVEVDKLFDFKRWGQVPIKDYVKTRQARWDRLVNMPEAEKTRGRLDVARFYLANGQGYEAVGMLSRVQEAQPDVDRRPEFLAVRGIGRVLTTDFAGAQADLSNRQLADEPDAALWRAAALAGQQDFVGAHAGFQAQKDLLASYPEPFFTGLSLSAADAALRAGQPEAAAIIMDRVAKRGGEAGPQGAAVQYYRGTVFRALGDTDKALSYFSKAQAGRDRLYAMRGKRDYIDTALAAGKMAPAVAAKQMETMRFAWRGDALELSNLRRIGEVHAIAGDYPSAFNTMRDTISKFPDTEEARQIAADMTRTFTELFGVDGAAKMPPLEALALYEQYRELTPPGPDGDRIIRKLAERMVEIDLLDRAAGLLDHQVQYRLAGLEKAQVGTRLAALRLLDGQPELALAALDKSATAEITPELAEERKLLRARALSQLGRGAEAVQLLAADQSTNANLLRIDIATRGKQWRAAAQALGDVIGPPPAAGATLDPKQSDLVVQRAIALSLSQDNAGMEALRRDFGPSMEKSRDSAAFRLLTRPEEAAGLADAATIRGRITEIDLFRSFLDAYRTNKQEAATPPPANAPAAPATPPPT